MNISLFRSKFLLFLSFSILFVPTRALCTYGEIETKRVPLERLLINLGKQFKKQPNDVKTLENLGRLHAMAYSKEIKDVEVSKDEQDLFFGTGKYIPFASQPPKRAGARLIQADYHLKKAVEFYKLAWRKSPNDLTIQMGLGWLLGKIGKKKEAIGLLRAVLKEAWPEHTIPSHTAFPIEGASYLMELLDPVADKAEIATWKERSKERDTPARFITPIVIPLKAGVSWNEIHDPDAKVHFDVDGTGSDKAWEWIRPSGAWLVHRPLGSEKIDSGLQLFGNVTFWLFWENGYRALSALDNDESGHLDGLELDGLGLWRDINQDGIFEEKSEFLSLDAVGIIALSCHHNSDTSDPKLAAFSANGALFRDGSIRPTFDLILKSRP